MTPLRPAHEHVRPASHMAPAAAFAAAVPMHALRAGHVRVLLADAEDWLSWEDEARALLDMDEHARVLRQRLPYERTVRTLAYAMHRLVVAGALECEPMDVPLYRDANGCPRLEGGVAWTSLSHAGGLLALAVGADGPVGVDIEPASRGRAMEDIAASVCHPQEWEALASWPAQSRATALLELWVRKEAALKAAGVGLEVPMESFMAPHSTPVRVPGFATCWQVTTVDAGPNATAAVAGVAGTKVECVHLRPNHVLAPPAARPAHVAVS